MHRLPDALAPLAQYRQFILYKIVPSQSRPGKMDKFPMDWRTGQVADAHDPAIWTDAQTAINTLPMFGPAHGIGFVFTDQDPFFFLDIDHCLIDGAWSQLAQSILNAFAGAAVEVSSSANGLHIIGTGTPPAHKTKNIEHGLELYHARRFVALTGTSAIGNAATDCSSVLPHLVAQFFNPGDTVSHPAEWGDTPRDEWYGPNDDDDLIRRAMNSKSSTSAFGSRASFADLFNRNVPALVAAYPDGQGGYDESSADRALSQHLSFWTGCNPERIRRIMLRSQLLRDKWQREDYLPRTILGAVAQQRDILQDKRPEPVANPSTSDGAPVPMEVDGSTFLGVAEQVKLFTGCVYLYESGRVLVPGGMLLPPERFRVMFGGRAFNMDNRNERTSRDAYEAFTQSQLFKPPTANGTCFRPDLPPGYIVNDAGRSRANVYWPVEVPRTPGDATPFMEHLARLLPNARDREIVLAYMCACVQHKGVKFQWAPLIQGTEGNGKTLLTRCVAEAIGKRYVHWPKASKLAAQFNSWMLYKLFYGVEDIYVSGSRLDVMNELKPMITGKELEIEGKGVDQISADVCGNFMLNSNHKDAILKSENDRRFAMFYTAQQSKEDLIRDGMNEQYFQRLYGWLDDGGFAIVADLLHTRPIPAEFNPAGLCQRAPLTSSTAEAIEESRGNIEQEILEAIAQEKPGFRGGWISSTFLTQLLQALNAEKRVPLNRRRELLANLGYVPHPGLKGGRLDNPVMPDGAKSRLFIRKEHVARTLTTSGDIGRAYSAAQMAS